MREIVLPADLELLRPLVCHPHVDSVHDPEVQLTVVKKREKGAGSRVRLDCQLNRPRFAGDFRQPSRQGVKDCTWRVRPDDRGLGQLSPCRLRQDNGQRQNNSCNDFSSHYYRFLRNLIFKGSRPITSFVPRPFGSTKSYALYRKKSPPGDREWSRLGPPLAHASIL